MRGKKELITNLVELEPDLVEEEDAPHQDELLVVDHPGGQHGHRVKQAKNVNKKFAQLVKL